MPTLQFKGKNIIWNHHLAVPFHTLDEVPELHYQPEKANGNMIIEGDNLLALKALLPQFAGKIKCIYIDPPYNTGKEGWVYNDKVNSPLITEWIGNTVGEEDLTRHDKWLCMIIPRLKMLRDLLKEDGILFISIDDNEIYYLKTILDEIFNEENFLGNIIWQTATDNNPTQVAIEHEYVLCYAKNRLKQDVWEIPSTKGQIIQDKYNQLALEFANDIEKIQLELRKWIRTQNKNGIDLSGVSHYSYVDEKGVFYPGNSANTVPGGYEFDILHPKTKKVCAKPKYGYRWPLETFKNAEQRGDVLWGEDETIIPKIKKRLDTATEKLKSVYYEDNRINTAELKDLFGKKIFDNPKSPNLLKLLFRFCTLNNDIILDSFAGSGTTMHAIMELNKEDGGNRKCIMIQMTEATDAEPDKNICKDITRERVKRAIDKYGYDSGFKYYRLGIPIDAETMLAGQLPTYKQFAKYVYYLCTGEHLEAEDKINEEEYYVGEYGKQAIYLVYKQDYETLTRLALNLTLAEKIKQQQPGKKRIVYAPSCFLDEEYLTDNQFEFVGIPYNLFQRNQ